MTNLRPSRTTLLRSIARGCTKEIVMPSQKDLKRLVRSRMKKTGEAYTAARLQVVKPGTRTPPAKPEPLKGEPSLAYAHLAGLADTSVLKSTGRTWAEWVRVLDAARATERPHKEIALYVSSLGTPDWWSQMVTVGYERIHGLRVKGQRRSGTYAASKSRTFAVPVETLFAAFANARKRRMWLPVNVTVRTSVPHKSMRLTWADDSRALLGFGSKGAGKSTVAVQHEKLPDKATADALKVAWSGYFDRLGQLLS
jgi:hypothetical protein